MSTDDGRQNESAPAPQRATLVVVVDVSADDLGEAQAAAARIAQTMRYRVLDALRAWCRWGRRGSGRVRCRAVPCHGAPWYS